MMATARSIEDEAKLTVVASGASGLLGTALVGLLSARGHQVLRLVRRAPKSQSEVEWDPDRQTIDKDRLASADVFVHLSGENVGEGRWTDERKRVLVSSRTGSTRLIAETIASLPPRQRRLVCASAIGFYGDQRPEPVDEASGKGEGFLADLCEAWEQAAAPAREASISTVHMRIGVVIAREGGALAKLLPIFKLGAGGPVASGKQMMSWISLADAVRAFHFAIHHRELEGPLNVVAPNPVDNKTFSKTLGHVLHRPAFVRVPAMALDVMFGQMGRETVLASQQVVPKALLAAGFQFEHPHVEEAIRAALG